MHCKVYVVSDEFGSTFRVVENDAAVKWHFKDLKGSIEAFGQACWLSAHSPITDQN